MGFFSTVFGSSSPIERQLEEQYVPMLQKTMGISAAEGKRTFSEMVNRARAESEREGTGKLPANFGDILLQREPTDTKVRAMLEKKRREGVNDDDIRWWWNMHDLERRIMLQVDELTRLAVFSKQREAGLSSEEAARDVRKIFPTFGDPDDTRHTSGDDRPLPHELKDRINTYIQRRAQADKSSFQMEGWLKLEVQHPHLRGRVST